MLYAICYMLYAICYMVYAICYMLYAICYMLYAICYMLYAIDSHSIKQDTRKQSVAELRVMYVKQESGGR